MLSALVSVADMLGHARLRAPVSISCAVGAMPDTMAGGYKQRHARSHVNTSPCSAFLALYPLKPLFNCCANLSLIRGTNKSILSSTSRMLQDKRLKKK